MTAESNPAQAALNYTRDTVIPPKSRPIGKLTCKIWDVFSSDQQSIPYYSLGLRVF
ncbi:hypothetical protein [Candidatus Albibeggiatoa sp. nov. BB20]|uniref:hypothetical protein n=1 Tax=Candidatus Albibeggiatoa sp. nov. BB20 TaxID=3162723 RepID=UPI0033654630